MYTQIFGNYLLNRNIITSEQLLDALAKQAKAHTKLGTLAVHTGYMTAAEAEQVYILQTHRDMRFGELAVECGFLTTEQVDELLAMQVPAFVLLGQILVENNILAPSQLENLIADYNSEHEIYDLDLNHEQKELIIHLLEDISVDGSHALREYLTSYLLLLFNNLIRFIGDDFTPLNILKMPDVPTNFCTFQELKCPLFEVSSMLDMNSETAIHFASRYAKENFTEFDEYVRASMEDFLNLHNGLFVVNISNEYSLEVSLNPPMPKDNTVFAPGIDTYLLPILYPFGIIHFIFTVRTFK